MCFQFASVKITITRKILEDGEERIITIEEDNLSDQVRVRTYVRVDRRRRENRFGIPRIH